MTEIAEVQAPPTGVVHIVDDDAGLCAGLTRLVRSVGYVAQPYNSVQAFLSAPRTERPSCILLDVRLPDMSGLDLQGVLGQYGIAHPVVMMTGYADIRMSVRAMKAGALDFLTKPFRDQDLLDAIARALKLDRERIAAEQARSVQEDRYRSLTERERQVFQGIVDGLMNKEIAERHGLSIVTIKVHRGTMTRKMGVTGTPDLVRAATLLGLCDA